MLYLQKIYEYYQLHLKSNDFKYVPAKAYCIQQLIQLQNLPLQLKEWKEPYLKQVKLKANQFHKKIKDYRNSQIEQLIQRSDQRQKEEKYIKKKENLQINYKKIDQQKVMIEQKNENKKIETQLQEWKSNIQYGFKDHQDLMKNYSQVFKMKQKVKKIEKTQVIEDFRADERQMVVQIFQEIRNKNQQTASFQAIEKFFCNFDLFYYFYNIHPHRLSALLRQSAKKYNNRLTKQQFLDLFLIDRHTVSQIKISTFRNTNVNSKLSQQNWKNLRAIFDTLDTFGNQKICIKTFFQRIRNNTSNINLLSSQAIQFPEIGRVYTLQKVLFDLENKMNFKTKVDWDTIQDAITHFVHIQQPTIDAIYLSNIQKAKIDKYSNYFLLQPEAIGISKQIFSKCPKYCEKFVKTTFFSFQLLESGLLKPFLNCAIRQQNSLKKSFITLQQVIKRLSKQAPAYIDMDEMLELLSIKGYQNSKNSLLLCDEISESSEEQTIEHKERRKLKKIKSLQQLKKTGRKKQKKKDLFEITKVKQFNLHKRQHVAIRQKKVHQMIIQKQRRQQEQLAKKFKANPIPVSLNPQRYQKYVKVLQKKKQSILNSLGMKRQKDQTIVDYLKSNTKLFEQKKIKNHCEKPKQNYYYEATPLPLHITEQLLPKIQAQKQQRRKKISEETLKKYREVYWKNIKNQQQSYQKDESLLQKINLIEQKNKPLLIKAKQVPDFNELHWKFQLELQSRKQKFQPTKIQQFKLSSPSHKKIKHQFLSPQIKHFKPSSPPKFGNYYEIRSTKKYEDWVAHNHAKMAEKELFQLQQQRQEQQRMIKQKNFAKFMRKYLSNYNNHTGLLRQKSEQKIKNYKQYIKKIQNETGDQLAQIYARVLQRPFLFEQAGSTRKPISKQRPKKVKAKRVKPKNKMPQNLGGYQFKDGLFQKDGQQFHPMESQNLNQSF